MDATTVFQDISHSIEAQKILSKYQIGELREVSMQFEVKFVSGTRSGSVTKAPPGGARVARPRFEI